MHPRRVAYVFGADAEKQLLAQLRAGEVAAYRQLYEMFAPRLQRTLERIFRDPDLAQDAVQTSFLTVFRKIGSFDGRASVSTWITRIGLREAGRLARARARWRGGGDHEELVDPSRSPEQAYSQREVSEQLAQLIASLSMEKRAALILFEVDGLSVQEIADIMDEPRGTVLARLSRLRADLREALQKWQDAGVPGARKGGAHE